MENLSLEQIRSLAQRTQQPSLSLFLPMLRTETHQNPVRFRNLLREARRQLLDQGMEIHDVDQLLQSACDLLDDRPFWEQPEEGLAVFLGPGDFRAYRLPIAFNEHIVIGSSYSLKPLFPLLTNNGQYYVLAVSQNDARLFRGTRHGIHQMRMPKGTPQNVAQAVRLDEPEKQVQHHTGAPQGGPRGGLYHGHGAGAEDQKAYLESYLNQLDASLKPIFDNEGAPLVLAGVDYMLSMYRRNSEYPLVMEEGIIGSPDMLSGEDLREQAWPIVEPYFRQEMDQMFERYQQFVGAGKSSDSVDEIASAAYYGRVESLTLNVGAQVWGRFNYETGRASHHQEQRKGDDLDLLDFAVIQTLQNGGRVFAASQEDLPTDAPMIAVFRY
jgi:hypothetical protein